MASPKELNLLAHDEAALRPEAPDLTATGSFAKHADPRLPVLGDQNGNGDGAPATAGATAPSSLVHEHGLRHALVEVMVVSPNRRVLLRRRRKDDEVAPDTFDVSASAHLLPGDHGDALAAAKRALAEAGLDADRLTLKPLSGEPERHRLEFPVGAAIENVEVHCFQAEGEAGEAGAAGGNGTPPPDGAERVWLDADDARRMLSEDPAVCSPFLAAGMKRWFGGAAA